MWILRLKGCNNITLQVGLTAKRCKFNHFCCSIPVSFNGDFRVFIRHQRSENSPFPMKNSPADVR